MVSVLMPTYNHERFVEEAIESVLAQDYPAELMDIVIVDDGSTDDTWARIQPYRDRVRAITKPNGGVISTVHRMFEEARGELVCCLSCDDVMHPHRVRVAAEILAARPEVSLVCSDADLIDAEGRTEGRYMASLGCYPPLTDDGGAASIYGLTISAPSAMFRLDQTREHLPIDPVAPWEDWWLFTHLLKQGLLWRVDDALVAYRRHETNLHYGASPQRALELKRVELPLRRWFVSDFGLEGVPLTHIRAALGMFFHDANRIASAGVASIDELMGATDEQRAASAEALARAGAFIEAGELRAAVKEAARAVALHPANPDAVRIYSTADDLVRRADSTTKVQTRGTVIAARWGELRQRPQLLESFAATARADDDVTLAIVAPGWSTGAVEAELVPMAERLGLLDGGPDMVVVQHEDPSGEGRSVVKSPRGVLTADEYVAAWFGAPAAETPEQLAALCGTAVLRPTAA